MEELREREMVRGGKGENSRKSCIVSESMARMYCSYMPKCVCVDINKLQHTTWNCVCHTPWTVF